MITLDIIPVGKFVSFTYTNKKGETKIVTGTITDRTDTKAGIRTWIWDGVTLYKGDPLSKQYDADAVTAGTLQVVR